MSRLSSMQKTTLPPCTDRESRTLLSLLFLSPLPDVWRFLPNDVESARLSKDRPFLEHSVARRLCSPKTEIFDAKNWVSNNYLWIPQPHLLCYFFVSVLSFQQIPLVLEFFAKNRIDEHGLRMAHEWRNEADAVRTPRWLGYIFHVSLLTALKCNLEINRSLASSKKSNSSTSSRN